MPPSQADSGGRIPHVYFVSRYFGCVEIHSAATAWPCMEQVIIEPSNSSCSGRQASGSACRQMKRVSAITVASVNSKGNGERLAFMLRCEITHSGGVSEQLYRA